MKIQQEILNLYLNHIIDSYRKFLTDYSDPEYAQRRLGEFENSIKVEYGSKYIKISAQGGVHSFICLSDEGKFSRGDILKAASWRAPAKNFSRGNIFKNALKRVTWCGAQ